MADRKLTVDIVANDKGFSSTIGSASKAMGGFALGVGALAGGAAVVGAKVLDMGVSLATLDAKAKTVFEGSLGEVESWAEGAAGAMGLTAREATGLATNMADLLKPMGFTADQAADMAIGTTDLAGALSAWSGGTIDAASAADIMTKAMLGETDGLKAMGIAISAADIDARLAAKGQSELTGAALAQAKALATQELIMEKSTDAQKAWADGTMDAVKRQNEAKAAFGEAKEAIVIGLLPALTAVANVISEHVIPWVEGLTSAFSEGGLGAAWDYVVDGWNQAWPRIQEFLGTASAALWEWVKEATPVVLAQLGEWLAALGAWLVDTALPWLGEKAAMLADKLWEWVKDATPPMLEQLAEWMKQLGSWLIDTGLPLLGEKLAQLGEWLAKWIADATPPALRKLLEWMIDLNNWIITEGIPLLAGKLVDLGLELVKWIADVGPDTLVKLGEWMVGIGAWVLTDGIPALAGFAVDMGKELIDGMIDGIGEVVSKLYTKVEEVVGKIADKIKGAINTIIRGWNSLQFSLPKVSTPIGDFGGWTVGTPDIPLLAMGGNVTQSGLAIVGERGPELLSLPQGARVSPLDRGSGPTIYVNVQVDRTMDLVEVGRTIGDALDAAVRSGWRPDTLALVG